MTLAERLADAATLKLWEGRTGHGGGPASYVTLRPADFRRILVGVLEIYGAARDRAAREALDADPSSPESVGAAALALAREVAAPGLGFAPTTSQARRWVRHAAAIVAALDGAR